jgi:4-amino-4-deoxy-L-arabinose transferase-like glycosyltransferase
MIPLRAARSRLPQVLGVLLATLLWRLPSLFDPPWVNDEGTYFAVAQAMAHGYRLYDGVWENKPPALYLVYSAIYHSFGPNLLALRILTAAVVLTLVAYSWRLTAWFCGSEWAVTGSFAVGLLFGVPFLEGTTGNAEVFVALLAAAAVDATLIRGRPVIGGALIGLAVLFKVVAAFDGVAIGFALLFAMAAASGQQPSTLVDSRPLTPPRVKAFAGFVLAGGAIVLVACVSTLVAGDLGAMVRNAFLYDIGYVGTGNGGGVPWALFAKVVSLVLAVLWARGKSFPVLWLVFATFGALFSGRIFGHYLLQPVVPAVLAVILLASHLGVSPRRAPFALVSAFVMTAVAAAVAGGVLARTQGSSILTSRLQYYANVVRLATGSESYDVYRSQIDDHVARNEALAADVRTLPPGTLLVWGNTPWIYVLSHRLPATAYTSSLRDPEVPGETSTLRLALRQRTPQVVVVISPALPALGTAREAIHNSYERVGSVGNAAVFVSSTRSR